jgi:hypothetical protein
MQFRNPGGMARYGKYIYKFLNTHDNLKGEKI